MIIPKPINHHIVENTSGDIVKLFFEKEQSREFYMRGAVAWLEGTKTEHVKPGFCIIAGQTMEPPKEVWLFDEFEFMTVDHWFNADQTLRQEGLSAFLLKCWSKYGSRAFFYNQSVEIHKRYLLQVIDSPMISPKPEFIQTPYTEDEKIRDSIIQEYLALGKLKGDKNTKLYEQIKSAITDIAMGEHCLRCLLGGFEAYPYIERRF